MVILQITNLGNAAKQAGTLKFASVTHLLIENVSGEKLHLYYQT
jgi:hypothetical protein